MLYSVKVISKRRSSDLSRWFHDEHTRIVDIGEGYSGSYLQIIDASSSICGERPNLLPKEMEAAPIRPAIQRMLEVKADLNPKTKLSLSLDEFFFGLEIKPFEVPALN